MDFGDEGIEAAVFTCIALVARSQVSHRCVYDTCFARVDVLTGAGCSYFRVLGIYVL